MSELRFEGRSGLQQRVLPSYRAAFFDLLARSSTQGMSVYAGRPRANEAIRTADGLNDAQLWPARNLHLLWGKLYFCWQRDIVKWLGGWDPHVLIMEANPRYLSSRRAVDWMHERHRPVIGWGLGVGQNTTRWKSYLRRYDALIAYSTNGAEDYRRTGFPADRVYTAPNAVVGLPPEIPTRTISDPLHVLFVGRLQERKRVDLLLKACRAQISQPRLTIVGDGPARAELQRIAVDEYPQAEFVGAKFGDELDEIFQRADLFVLPGTGGFAVQQAMAHALPVIVAEADGSQRDLVDQGNGWLVSPGDLNALSDALSAALDNPERLPQMGAASHAIVRERVNIEVMAKVFVTAINEAIAT